MNAMIFRFGRWSFMAALLLLLTGCGLFSSRETVDNNALNIPDLVRHFEKSGIKITSISLVRADVIHADDAVAIKIDGKEIGIYKFNIKIRKQREKLEHITSNGFVHLVGFKYNTITNGSFLMVGADGNPQYKELEKTFMAFK